MSVTVGMILKAKGRFVWSVAPKTTVFEAISLMAKKGIGAVVVMHGESLVGIMSERDYMRRVILKGRASKETDVEAIMTRDVITASCSMTENECMALMTERKIRHLPVLDNTDVVGIISLGDVVKTVIDGQGVLINQLERYITGSAWPAGPAHELHAPVETSRREPVGPRG